MASDDYEALIESIAAAHKRGHLVAIACVCTVARNKSVADIIGEGDALALLADHIHDALRERDNRKNLN